MSQRENISSKPVKVAGSFRDPSGFIFTADQVIYRQVNHSYEPHYQKLFDSGLYQKLVEQNLLIEHVEVSLELALTEDAYKVIRPTQVPFISYPYEWCFSELKDAALTTLKIALTALEHGMVLKDASAFNIQFVKARPILIDTLSFENYREGTPWIAYKQFCEHFLAPLALMAYRKDSLNQLLKIHLDGIPLDLATELLPRRAWLRVGLWVHLWLHALSQKKMAGKKIDVHEKQNHMSIDSSKNLIAHLKSMVEKINLKRGAKTTWSHYYDEDLVGDDYFKHKKELVKRYAQAAGDVKHIWDLGANRGEFSEIVSTESNHVISWDFDTACVEQHYLKRKAAEDRAILPLVLDLTNPTPALGWNHEERLSLADRGPVDLVFALALIHHLAIGNNVPLEQVASFFRRLGRYLIVEFVPKNDKRVQQLLLAREDIFTLYRQDSFEAIFAKYFEIVEKATIRGSERVLYLMRGRS